MNDVTSEIRVSRRVSTLIDQARTARAEASQKILGITNGTVDADALAARLRLLRTNLQSITSVGQGDWQEARRLLGQLDQQTAALRDEVTLALGAVKGPLDTRNELRGRLDAYHAKALAIGLAEDEIYARVTPEGKLRIVEGLQAGDELMPANAASVCTGRWGSNGKIRNRSG